MLQVINFHLRAEGREEERGEVRRIAPTCKTTAFNSLAECGPLTLYMFTVYDLCNPPSEIQFTLAFGVRNCVPYSRGASLKEQGPSRGQNTSVSIGVSAVSVAGRHYRLSLVEVSKTNTVSRSLKPSSSHITICSVCGSN